MQKQKGISRMQSSMPVSRVRAEFDEPNLVAYGGLEPLVRLAEQCGLPGLVGELVQGLDPGCWTPETLGS